MLQAMKAEAADVDTSEPEDDESIDTHRLTTQFDHVEEVRISMTPSSKMNYDPSAGSLVFDGPELN